MTIDERTYNKVARLIEQARHRIGTRVIERFPFSYYDDGAEIAVDHGYKISNAERRLRNETSTEFLPIVKLGRDKKPIVGSKRIYFYSWKGARTALRVEQDKLEKRPKRNKQYA